MLDWEGNMQPKKDRQHRIVLLHSSRKLLIYNLIQDDEQLNEMGTSFIPRPGDHISSTLGSISNTLVDLDLSSHIQVQ